MQQPTDILDLIFEALEPESTVLWSLTCKGLRLRYFDQALSNLKSASPENSHAFQLLMERDIGHRQYYCPSCRSFQTFKADWTAGPEKFHRIHSSYKGCREQCYTKPFRPNSKGYELDYCLGRLVMNRHLLGTPRGLPLDCLEAAFTVVRRPYMNERTVWTQDWKAKIIDNALFLCATHVADQASLKMSAQDFRDAVDSYWYCICSHKYAGKYSNGVTELKAPRDPFRQGLFVPCKDSQAACDTCHTDYKVTIKWCAGQGVAPVSIVPRVIEVGSWNITIVTYHRLGSFRSLDDPEWRSAVHTLPGTGVRKMSLAQLQSLGLQPCPPGSIIRRWEEC